MLDTGRREGGSDEPDPHSAWSCRGGEAVTSCAPNCERPRLFLWISDIWRWFAARWEVLWIGDARMFSKSSVCSKEGRMSGGGRLEPEHPCSRFWWRLCNSLRAKHFAQVRHRNGRSKVSDQSEDQLMSDTMSKVCGTHVSGNAASSAPRA
jgi:hypothetical protein